MAKIGVVEYTIRHYLQNPVDYKEAHEKLAQMGVEYIQGGVPKFLSLEEYKKGLDELGLHNISAGGQYDDIMADPQAIADKAKFLGTRFVSVATIPIHFRMRGEEGYKAFAKAMQEKVKFFRAQGLELTYHNHAVEFVNFDSGKRGMDILFEETEMDLMLDTHWVAAGGADPAAWIKKCKGRIPVVHYKDYGIANVQEQDYMEMKKVTEIGGVYKRFMEIGCGNLNWPAIVEATKEAGSELVMIEQDFTLQNPFNGLQTSINNIKSWGI